MIDARGHEWDYGPGLEAEGETYDLIFGLIRVLKPKVCVETGTGNGRGTGCIARALDANGDGHLWTVDNADQEIDRHARVTQVREDSLAFVRGFGHRVDFAFVDCCFDRDGRKAVVVELLGGGCGTVLMHDTKLFGLPAKASPTLQLPTLNGLAIWCTP